MVIEEVGSSIRQIKGKGMTITFTIKASFFKLFKQGVQGFESFYGKRGQGYWVLSGKVSELGGAKEDRTPDLYNAIVALSQLSYGPTCSSDL